MRGRGAARALWALGAAALALGATLAELPPAAPGEPVAIAGAGPGRVAIELTPRQATVGDRLTATLDVELPAGVDLTTERLGPDLGPFSVLEQAWEGPVTHGEARRWRWRASLAAFRTGELELPALQVTIRGPAGESALATEPVAVTIASVLEQSAEADLEDLKDPAAVPADYVALWLAGAAVLLLAAVAGALWWLNRRYAGRFAAAPAPEDPFRRMPPHVWVYGELQRLLASRLAEQGQADRFFEELSRIVKLYLGGRYRVDLMERTTAEVPERLRQGGAAREAIGAISELLTRCDMVKFAHRMPSAGDCRAAVEDAYAIVDATKPADAPSAEAEAARGAA